MARCPPPDIAHVPPRTWVRTWRGVRGLDIGVITAGRSGHGGPATPQRTARSGTPTECDPRPAVVPSIGLPLAGYPTVQVMALLGTQRALLFGTQQDCAPLCWVGVLGER